MPLLGLGDLHTDPSVCLSAGLGRTLWLSSEAGPRIWGVFFYLKSKLGHLVFLQMRSLKGNKNSGLATKSAHLQEWLCEGIREVYIDPCIDRSLHS